jgi:hypothetical protein
MNTKQAKDFLVQQTSEQAALENASLSDFEKRMMYFTESDLGGTCMGYWVRYRARALVDAGDYFGSLLEKVTP